MELRPARSRDLRKMEEGFPACRIRSGSADDHDRHDQQIHLEELCTHTDTIGYRAVSGSFINYSVARKVDRTLKLFVQGLGSRGYM